MKPLMLSLILALTILPADAETTAKPDDAMTDWVLDQIDGAAPGWPATISLAEPGRISGQAPCNRYFAGATIRDGSIAIQPIAATRMACADLAGEARFFQLLQGMTVVEQSADSLVLIGGGHQMAFVRAP
jgi:heat shock protein HslJ